VEISEPCKGSILKIIVAVIVVIMSVVFGVSEVQAESQNILMWPKSYHEKHTRNLLEHVLNKSIEKYGEYQLLPSENFTQGRAFSELAQNSQVNIVTAAPFLDRDKTTHGIPIPINRGLLGVRICLLNKGNTQKFKNIKTLQDLIKNKVVFGQGEHWPDTHILQASGLSVFTSPLHVNLHEMLRAGRFDCFPRAISELDDELEQYGSEGLEVENSFALVYKLPLFFWINPNNRKLIDRVHSGLLETVVDESYYEMNDEFFEPILKKYNIESRNIIFLENPYTSEQINSIKHELWHPILQKHFPSIEAKKK
jgi:hypothetical protein